MSNDDEEPPQAAPKRGARECETEDESHDAKHRKVEDSDTEEVDLFKLTQKMLKLDRDLRGSDSESVGSLQDVKEKKDSRNIVHKRQSSRQNSMPDQGLKGVSDQDVEDKQRFVINYENRIVEDDSIDFEDETFRKNDCFNLDDQIFGIKHFLHDGNSECTSALCVELIEFSQTVLETVQDTSDMENLTPKNIGEFVQRAGSDKEIPLSDLKGEEEELDIEKLPNWMYIERQSGSSSLLFGFVDISKKPIRNGLRKSRPKGIDFFAGAGLASRGFEASGCKIVASIEKNKEAVYSYARIHKASALDISSDEWTIILKEETGRVAFYGTAEDFLLKYEDNRAFRKALGTIDIVVLCPPCQGFSKQNIFKQGDVEQNNNESLRILKAAELIRPKVFAFENVLGLWEKKHIEDYFQKIVYGLMDMGYNVQVGKLCAADFGDPQFRPRLILIASLSQIGLPVYPRSTHGLPFVGNDVAGGLLPVVTVRDSLRQEEGKHPENERPINLDDRRSPNQPAGTVMASKSAPHYSENRLYSLVENSILMGQGGSEFVTKLEGNNASKQRQIGNGVPMRLTKAIGRAVMGPLEYNWVGVDDISANFEEEEPGIKNEQGIKNEPEASVVASAMKQE